jgi:hypothetical protein
MENFQHEINLNCFYNFKILPTKFEDKTKQFFKKKLKNLTAFKILNPKFSNKLF